MWLFLLTAFAFGNNLANAQTTVTIDSETNPGNIKPISALNLQKWEKNGLFGGFSPQDEILSKRTQNTKHFRKENGDIVAQIGGNYHYQDENAQWQDIDFTITKSNSEEFAYSNNTNTIKTFFPETAGNTGIAIKDKLIDIKIWKNPELLIYDANNKIIHKENSLHNSAKVTDNIVRYQSFNGVIDEIKIIDNGLENNIIISNLQEQWTNLSAASTISFKQFVELPNDVKVLNSNGDISKNDFTDEYIGLQFADGQILYLNSLIVFDAQANKDDAQLFFGLEEKDKIPEDIKTKAKSFYKGLYTIKFVGNGIEIYSDVSLEYLQQAQYPVTIDPTWTVGSTASGTYYSPLSHWFGYQRHASLYKQSEINGYGFISQIEYYKTGTQTARTKPTKVYMREMTENTITSTNAWNSATYTGGLTALYDGTTTQDNTTGWKAIPLTTSYNYSSGNLLVMVYDAYGGSGSTQNMAHENATGLQTKKRGDTTDPGDASAMATESYRSSIRITYIADPCAGTPDPGNTIVSENPVCVGNNFSLSLENPSSDLGMTYQWQSSPDNATWTNIGTGLNTLTTFIGEKTYYQCIVTCTNSSESATSTPVEVNINIAALPYIEEFITTSTPACWTTTGWTIGSTRGVTGNPGNNIYKNLSSTAATATFTTGGIGPITSGTYLFFDYITANYSSPYAPPATGTGNFVVSVSIDGGNSYTELETVANDGLAGWKIKYYDLSPYVGDIVKFKFVGNRTSGDYDLAFDNITLDLMPTCQKPMNLFADNITATSATINWEEMGSATSWNLKASTTPIDPINDPADFEMTLSSNPFSVPEGTLEQNTTYYWYIQANCGVDDLSDWSAQSEFTTECGIAGIPYSQDFESAIVPELPNCTSAQNVGSGNIWVTANNPGYGFTTKVLYYQYDWDFAANTWFYTQAIDLVAGTSYRLTFKYSSNSTISIEKLKVSYGASPVNTDMTTTIVDIPSIINITPNESTTDFTPSVSGTYYLGFNCYSAINQYYLYVDDILLDLSPSCFKPTELYVNNTTTTSANLNWTQIGTPDSWNLKVTTSATFDPTTETGEIFDGVASGNPHLLADLDENTTYYWYVQANCGVGDLSVWSEQGTFNTQCEAFSIPFNENFDSYAIGVFPNCWARPVTYGTSTIFPSCADAIYVNPPYSLKFQSSTTEPTYAVTPAFAEDINNLMLKFKLKASSTTSSGSIEVGVMSDPYDINTFELIQTITPNTTNWTDYTIYIINTTIAGANNHIAFKHISTSTSSYYYLDNVQVDLLPDCPAPVNLFADITSPTTAELNWTQAGTCDTWNIKVSTTIINPATTDGDIIPNASTMDNPYALSGLTPNETYYFYVQADCGAETSDWSVQGSFYLGYCISTGNSTSYYINNFETSGGTDNISNLTSGYSTNGYQDATAMVVSQYATGTVFFDASFGSSTYSTFGFGVWVDWNNDMDFDDPGENVYISSSYNSSYSESFQVPAGIANGNYRMRIVADFNNSIPTPCNATGINGETEDYTFTVINPPACMTPTNLFADNITTTSANLNWTEHGTSTDWNLKVTTSAAFDPTTGTGEIFDGAATGNPHTLSGISENTTYYWYVQANCGGETSEWSLEGEFTSPCEAFSVPFTESFDTWGTGSDAFPDCWTRPITYGTSPIYPSCVSEQSVSSPNSLRFQSALDNYTCAVTPAFAEDINNLMVSFKLRREGTSSGVIEVGVMSDPNDVNTFELVETIDPATTGTWINYEIMFNSTTLSGPNNFIAFRQNPTATYYYYWLDDVTVDVIPTCPKPTELFADNITSTSASLNWTDNSSATSWTIKYSTTPIVPSVDPGDGEITTSSNPFDIPISSLTPNTTYYWYVQANCGVGDLSYWSDEDEFTTECLAVEFFDENFDGVETMVLPDCWSAFTSPNYIYQAVETSTTYSNSAPNSVKLSNSGASVIADAPILISPILTNLNSGNKVLSFFAKGAGSNTSIVVGTMSDPNDYSSFTQIETVTGLSTTTFTEYIVSFESYAGTDEYISLRHPMNSTYGTMYIDDIKLRLVSDENDILTFSFPEQTGPATITTGQIDIAISSLASLNALTPTITISDYATINPTSGVEQDFTTSPFVYTVTSESNIDQTWNVYVTQATELSDQKDILTFTLPEQTGVADIGDDYVNIEVAWNANLTNLTPTITVSDLATVSPESGISTDFSLPVTYTVTAEDATTKDYTVNVTPEAIPAGATCTAAIDYGLINDPAITSTLAAGDNIWYTFTLDQDYANVVVSACGSDFDTRLGVYADCGDFTGGYGNAIGSYPSGTIGWDEDGCAGGEYGTGNSYASSIDLGTLTAGTYYAVLYGYAAASNGNTRFEVTGSNCVAPNTISASNLTATSADITWVSSVLNETSWNIKINEATAIADPSTTDGDIVPNALVETNPLYQIATGTLTEETDYYVYLQSACGSDWIDFMFTTPSSCPVPTGLTSSNIEANSATLSWTELGMEAWVIEISSTPLTDPDTQTGNIADNVDVTGTVGTYNATGLESNTTYYWYVKSACGSDWSAQEEFTTLCGTFSIPFTEDFTGVTTNELPLCWDQSHAHWSVQTSAEAGGTAPELEFDYNPTTTGELKVFTPVIDATTNSNLAMTFLHYVYHYQNSFDIKVEYTIDNGVTWTTAWDMTVTNDVSAEEVSVDLSSYVDGEVFQLAFVFDGNSFDIFNWNIDNINIFEATPPAIDQINLNSEVTDVNVCAGDDLATAIAALAPQMTISDTESNEYLVDLTWTIDAYDANTPAVYNATGTFELPTGVVQSDPVTPLEIGATVTVNALPVVTCPETMNVAVNTLVAFTGQTPAGGTFTGTGVVGDTFDPNGLDNGTYIITYTYTDPTTGCDNSCDFNVIVDVDISVADITVESIGIFPNPNKGEFTIDFSNIQGDVSYQVYDTKGSIIVQREIPTNGNTVEEVSVDLTPGVYYVKIVTTNQTFVEKLVIE